MKLKNLMEEAVKKAIEETENTSNYCRCDKCKLDIAAISLNKLPPRYVVTDKGDSYGRADFLELQNYIDILSIVTEAMHIVGRKPNH